MKGRTPSKADRKLWDELAQLGCIACRKDGRFNPMVSIHHIDGRTKPGAHQKVLPLCFHHHQGDGRVVPAIHGNKAQFERLYGQQEQLLGECLTMIARNKTLDELTRIAQEHGEYAA